MATDKTKALTQPQRSTLARQWAPTPTEKQRDAAKAQPNFKQREAVSQFRSRDGCLYMHDGISIRRVTHK